MTAYRLRPGARTDADAIIRLNSASVSATSPMDGVAFSRLFGLAHSTVIAEDDARHVVGFLIAFSDGSDYDSPNYRWFAQRLKRFYYIDRVVVAAQCRGHGIGRLFYANAAEVAAKEQCFWLAAEMNIDPPNEASLRFHARQGFVEIGQQRLPAGKTVSMQIRATSGT